MEYTVQKLGLMAGISTRTLRYYDEIGILKPARINSSGYRIYGQAEVDKLQQILFYRELGVSLENIKDIVNDPSFDCLKALGEHREKLIEKRKQLDLLIANVDKSIASLERKISMTDPEKFEGFKQKIIDDNEKKYGKEIRAKYGDEQVDRSNKKFKSMTAAQYTEVEKLGADVLETLKAAMATGDPAGEPAQKLRICTLAMLTGTITLRESAVLPGCMWMMRDLLPIMTRCSPVRVFRRDAILIYTGMDSQE